MLKTTDVHRIKALAAGALVQALEEHAENSGDWASGDLGDFRFDGGFDPNKIVDRMYELLLEKLKVPRA